MAPGGELMATRTEDDRERPARIAGLAFVNGASSGWLGSDLSAWSQRHLIANRFLSLKRPELGSYMVEENGAGRVSLPVAASQHPSRATTSNAMRVVAQAHERVLIALRGMLATPPDDRFVNGALYTGRVQRGRGAAGPSEWLPTLDEGGSLSQWVLALFAADALTDRPAYEVALGVCDACGLVGFAWPTRARSRCPAHDAGQQSLRPTPRQITIPPPSARPTPTEPVPEDMRSTRPWIERE